MTSPQPRIPRAPPAALRLRCLGAADLRTPEERELRAVLRQPKRLLLLCYLVLARPRGFHRRDVLLGLFWPELDDPHARNALSQALRYLRRAIDSAIVRNRGRDEVGVDPERLWCDVLAFDSALAEGRLEPALTLYRGDLLAGLHVSGGRELERWLQEERTRLRRDAATAAAELTDQWEAAGDGIAAVRWALRHSELLPYDEIALRRATQLLDAVGNRAGAVRLYEIFAARLREDLDLSPAPETRALIRRIRER